jgi:hypothetical protein
MSQSIPALVTVMSIFHWMLVCSWFSIVMLSEAQIMKH